jgi:hypothetical protein
MCVLQDENKFKSNEERVDERSGILYAPVFFLLILKDNFSGARARLSQSSLGQRKYFRGLHAARGPRVVQAWCRQFPLASQRRNNLGGG